MSIQFLRRRVITNMFKDLIGKPWKFGGRGPNYYDCWGLVMEVCRRLAMELPDFAAGCPYVQVEIDKKRRSFEDRFVPVHDPMPGDIVAFRFPMPMYVGHIGVIIEDPYFMHTREATNVVTERIDSPIWRKKIYGVYRFADNQGN